MKDKPVNTQTCTHTQRDHVGIVESGMLGLYSQSLIENMRTISFLIESSSLFHCFINNFALHYKDN